MEEKDMKEMEDTKDMLSDEDMESVEGGLRDFIHIKVNYSTKVRCHRCKKEFVTAIREEFGKRLIFKDNCSCGNWDGKAVP